jgi:hypothetical protein
MLSELTYDLRLNLRCNAFEEFEESLYISTLDAVRMVKAKHNSSKKCG